MRRHDAATSPLASHRPDVAGGADSLRDHLREAFAEKFPALKLLAFDLIDEAIAAAGGEAVERQTQGITSSDSAALLAQLVRLTGPEHDRAIRSRAFCFLRLLGHEPRSLEQLAHEVGYQGRAAVHSHYRQLQRETGLANNADKPDSAREKCRKNRTGQRRPRIPWGGKGAWQKARAALVPTLNLAVA